MSHYSLESFTVFFVFFLSSPILKQAYTLAHNSSSQLNFASSGQLAILEDILESHNCKDATDTQWVEARDVAEHPKIYRRITHNK